MNKTLAFGLSLALLAAPKLAHAFCGFYVSGADAKLFNDATQVALMREGTRTAISMQNSYKGPPENFAMVESAKFGLDYGRQRLWASVSFIVGTLVSGFALEIMATSTAVLLIAVSYAALGLAAAWTRRPRF